MLRLLIAVLLVLTVACATPRVEPVWIASHVSTSVCPGRIGYLDVTLRTANVKDAGTRSQLRLLVTTADYNECDIQLPDLPGHETDRNQVARYVPLEPRPCLLYVDDIKRLSLRIDGDQAWLPSYVAVLAYAEGVEGPITLVNQQWPGDQWFSTDPKDQSSSNLVLPKWDLDLLPR